MCLLDRVAQVSLNITNREHILILNYFIIKEHNLHILINLMKSLKKFLICIMLSFVSMKTTHLSWFSYFCLIVTVTVQAEKFYSMNTM